MTKKTPRIMTVKPHDVCHRVDLIQDFATCPKAGDRFLCNFV